MSLYGYVEGRDDGKGVNDNIILRCDCVDQCELEIQKDNEEKEYYFIFKTKNRYNTLNIFEALKIKLKKIWCIIRGKDYLYYDIEVNEGAMLKFIDGLQKLANKK